MRDALGIKLAPGCSVHGAPVNLRTVKALLTEGALRRGQPTHDRFCASATCAAVYFGEVGDQFLVQEIRVPVWQKEQIGSRLLCYCFGETEEIIARELSDCGRTDVVGRIREHIAGKRCACDIRNPRGACCLGDVMSAVQHLESAISSAKDD